MVDLQSYGHLLGTRLSPTDLTILPSANPPTLWIYGIVVT